MIYQLFAKKAEEFPDKHFLIYKEESLSYHDVQVQVEKLARLLEEHHVSTGSHVAIYMQNSPLFIVAWFAVMKLGAVMVPVHTELSEERLNYILSQSDSELIIHDPGFRDMVNRTRFNSRNRIELIKDTTAEIHIEEERSARQSKLSDTAAIVYTSGTTSYPKGVVISHRCYLEAGKDMMNMLGISADERMYVFLPLFHVNPQMYGVMSALYAGATIVIGDRFSASDFWRTVERYDVSYFTYVGTVLSILAKGAPEKNHHVKRCVGGGAPRLVWEAIENKFNVQVMELYGMTEIGGFTTGNSSTDYRKFSVGKPRESMEVAVVDADDLILGPNQKGEIAVRPKWPNVIFEGYYKQPEKTLESLRNLWFHTGDLGYFDSDGYLYYEGRLKEIIRHNGENVSPFEVESILMKNKHILDAAAIGIPDEIAEEEIKVCVITDGKISEQEIYQYCKENLSDFMIPRYVEVMERIPKTATQKVERFKLRYVEKHIFDVKKYQKKV